MCAKCKQPKESKHSLCTKCHEQVKRSDNRPRPRIDEKDLKFDGKGKCPKCNKPKKSDKHTHCYMCHFKEKSKTDDQKDKNVRPRLEEKDK